MATNNGLVVVVNDVPPRVLCHPLCQSYNDRERVGSSQDDLRGRRTVEVIKEAPVPGETVVVEKIVTVEVPVQVVKWVEKIVMVEVIVTATPTP